MKVLILTQKIDKNDPVLGFFHGWVEEFSRRFESIIVICLQKGEYALPSNVKVMSLGKELGFSILKKIKYIFNFFKHAFFSSLDYDAVLVHMNQEYVLLGGLFWRLSGKKVYMWRNHHAGNWWTDLAALFCTNVFCTSKYSYTVKYKKTILMPIGVDINKFAIINDQPSDPEAKNRILFLGRISPTKNVHIFIEALGLLKRKRADFTASIYGDALPKDDDYYKSLLSLVEKFELQDVVRFYKGVPNDQTPGIYNAHQIYVNLSSSGMYDKTIFEAFACGCLVLASNQNLKGEVDEMCVIEGRQPEEVSRKMEAMLLLSDARKNSIISENRKFAKFNSLEALSEKIGLIISI